MKSVIQRARQASVSVEGSVIGSIDKGLVVLLGVANYDEKKDAEFLAGKIARLRIFPDENGKPNRSLLDTGYGALVISQFTLLANARKGNRPSYIEAAPPDLANELYEHFVHGLREYIGLDRVATGRFAAMMDVDFVNEGPYTILLDSRKDGQ